MDAELKQHLEAMEARLKAHTDETASRLKEHTAGQIDAAEDRLRNDTRKECEKVETALLTEFHKWGRTSDMRTRDALTHAAALAERLLAAETA
jgi:hypothetical protein